MNPLLEMAAGAPKVRTLCSKWLLERQKYEPFARNGSWSAQSLNPLLKMAPGAPKVRTLCSKWQPIRKDWRYRPRDRRAGQPLPRTPSPISTTTPKNLAKAEPILFRDQKFIENQHHFLRFILPHPPNFSNPPVLQSSNHPIIREPRGGMSGAIEEKKY